MHSAVLRAVEFVRRRAKDGRLRRTRGGEMASNPAQVIMLLGLGLKDLSMTPSAIPPIRRLVRSIGLEAAEKIAREAVDLNTPAEVHRYVNLRLPELGSQFFATAHFG